MTSADRLAERLRLIIRQRETDGYRLPGHQMDADALAAYDADAPLREAQQAVIDAAKAEAEYHVHTDAYADPTSQPCYCSLCEAVRKL